MTIGMPSIGSASGRCLFVRRETSQYQFGTSLTRKLLRKIPSHNNISIGGLQISRILILEGSVGQNIHLIENNLNGLKPLSLALIHNKNGLQKGTLVDAVQLMINAQIEMSQGESPVSAWLNEIEFDRFRVKALSPELQCILHQVQGQPCLFFEATFVRCGIEEKTLIAVPLYKGVL